MAYSLDASMRDFCSQMNMYRNSIPTPQVLSDLQARSASLQAMMRNGPDAVIGALDANQVKNFKAAVIQLNQLEECVKQVSSQQIAPPLYFQPVLPPNLPLKTYIVDEQRVEELQKISSAITELEKTLVQLEEEVEKDQAKESTDEFVLRFTQTVDLMGEIKERLNDYLQDQETIEQWNKELSDCDVIIKNISVKLFS